MYVNDLAANLADGVCAGIYAGGAIPYTLPTARGSSKHSCGCLLAAVDAVTDWGDAWRITFGPTKFQAMTMPRKGVAWGDLPLTFAGTMIPELSRAKLLGVTFDRKPSHGPHIKRVAPNVGRRMYFFRRASSVLNTSGRRAVYKGFVRPLMEYLPQVWMGAAAINLRRFDAIQRKAINVVPPCTTWNRLRPVVGHVP